MKFITTDVASVLTALHQAYYGMYALLLEDGSLSRGDLAARLSDESLKHHVGEPAAEWLKGIAVVLERIDAGNGVSLSVIDGGKKD